MPNKEQSPEECDPTSFNSSNAARPKKFKPRRNKNINDYPLFGLNVFMLL